MIGPVRPGDQYTARLEFVADGLLALAPAERLRFAVHDGATVIEAPTSAGIERVAAGVYEIERVAPTGTDGWLSVVWAHGDPPTELTTYTEDLLVSASLVPAIGPVSGALVLSEIEALLEFRRRVSGFSAGAGGSLVPHFTSATRPTLEAATRVANRVAAAIVRDYPSAVEVDAPDLVWAASLAGAIELELSVDKTDFDRVREWRASLKDALARLTSRLGTLGADPDADGVAGMAARWYFGPREVPRAAGAEFPTPEPSGRRLRW